MRRHYIVVQLPTSAPVAELVPEMIAVAWGVSAIMTNIKVTNMKNTAGKSARNGGEKGDEQKV